MAFSQKLLWGTWECQGMFFWAPCVLSDNYLLPSLLLSSLIYCSQIYLVTKSTCVPCNISAYLPILLHKYGRYYYQNLLHFVLVKLVILNAKTRKLTKQKSFHGIIYKQILRVQKKTTYSTVCAELDPFPSRINIETHILIIFSHFHSFTEKKDSYIGEALSGELRNTGSVWDRDLRPQIETSGFVCVYSFHVLYYSPIGGRTWGLNS